MESKMNVIFQLSNTLRCSQSWDAKCKFSIFCQFWISTWTVRPTQLRSNTTYRHATVDPNKIHKIRIVKIAEYGTVTHILRVCPRWANYFWEMGFLTGITLISIWKRNRLESPRIKKWSQLKKSFKTNLMRIMTIGRISWPGSIPNSQLLKSKSNSKIALNQKRAGKLPKKNEEY